MSRSPGEPAPNGLRRADFVIIPLLVVITLAAMAVGGEFVSRRVFVESGRESCVMPGPAGARVMRPNCVSYRKAAEGPPTVNAYNDCGYRTPQPCRTRPVDGIRIALMGASTAEGMKVPYQQTFAARLTDMLTRACHRPVEFQNMGVPGATLLEMYRRLDEALAMHPDVVMLVISPYEMKEPIDPVLLADRDMPASKLPAAALPEEVDRPQPAKSLISRLSDMAYHSRLLVVAQHFLFQDRATYVKLYMLHGEDAGYLRVPFDRGWQHRVADFATLLGEMADRTRAAGVPMVLVLGPQRIQAALLDPRVRPPHVDPFAIGRHLQAVAARHGVAFQDTLDGFAKATDPDDMFYAVDGHMDATGNAVFARSVFRRLVADVGPFRACSGDRLAGN